MYSDDEFLSVIEFLTNPRVDVVTAALEAILGLCNESDFISFLRRKDHANRLIRPLLRAVGANDNVSTMAAACLVNISDTSEVATAMITLNAVDRLLDNLKNQLMNQATIHEHLNLMILSNLTQHRDGRAKLLQLHETEAVRGSHLLILLGLFKKTIAKSIDNEYPDRYLWVSHILCNLSTDHDGRHYLVSRLGVDGLMELCVALNQFEHPERRLMILRTLRNLFADKTMHNELCSETSLILDGILCMVYPRPGSEARHAKSTVKDMFNEGYYDERKPEQKAIEAPSHEKEQISEYVNKNSYGPVPLKELRMLITDLLADVCLTCEGRESLRIRGTYEIIRVWHLAEPEEIIKESIEDFVHMIHYSEEELKEQDKQAEAERAAAIEASSKIEEISDEPKPILTKKIDDVPIVTEPAAIKIQEEPKVSVEEALAQVSDMFGDIELESAEMYELD